MKDQDVIRNEALEFIKSKHTGVLATSNLAGESFASTVYFVSKDDFTIYFSTSHSTNKFKNILLNKKVAFCIGNGPEYKSIQIRGLAEMVFEKDQEEGLNLLQNLYTSHPKEKWPINAINKLKEGGFSLIRIVPTSISFLNADSPSGENGIYELLS